MEEKQKILKGDKYIWGTYFALCFISIIAMYSASGTLSFKGGDTFDPILRHTIYLILGTILVYFIHLIHYKYFRLLGFPLFVVACVLLVYALFFGEKVNDASRWVSLMGIRMQPSELAKMGVVITVAFFLAKGQTDKGVASNTFSRLLAVIGISCLLIFTENFSTALLLGVVSFCMMLIGGVPIKKLAALLLAALLFVGGILYTAHKLDKGDGNQNSITKIIHRANTWNERLAGFGGKGGLPEYMEKTTDDNYQEHHARMAIAHGHGIGVGPGNSRERDFLPQAYSDFIYAIIIEESGILGGLLVMFLYISVLMRALRNAKKCTRAFPAFLMLGIAMLIVFQAIINMSVATGLIPVTGQPLPLISRGGTSIVITCCYFGMLLSISRFATAEGIEEEKMAGSSEPTIPEDIAATNPNLIED